MGKIIFNNKEIGFKSCPSIAYVTERAISDDEGNNISVDYLKANQFLSDNALFELEEQPNAGFHNSFYRGKNIEYKFTDKSIYAKIADGSFEDLFIGDYFRVQNTDCYIAGFDIMLNNGDTALTDHHIVCISSGGPYSYGRQFNSTETTVGGYKNSTIASQADNAMCDIFTGDYNEHYPYQGIKNHICTFKELVSNSVASDVPNGPNPYLTGASNNWEWVAYKACLLTEIEVSGSMNLSSSGYDIGTGKTQLPIFKFSKYINDYENDQGIMTRGIASNSRVVTVNCKSSKTDTGGGCSELGNPTYDPYKFFKFCLKG